jgi:hypothetical protein
MPRATESPKRPSLAGMMILQFDLVKAPSLIF